MAVTSFCSGPPAGLEIELGLPDCQGQYDNAEIGVWYDENFVDDDGGDDAFIMDSFSGQYAMWQTGCIDIHVTIGKVALALDLKVTCEDGLKAWAAWVNTNYPATDRAAGAYTMDAWQLFTGRQLDGCVGRGYVVSRTNGDADSSEISIVETSKKTCGWFTCNEGLRSTKMVGLVSGHELGHNWASLPDTNATKCTGTNKYDIMHGVESKKDGYCFLDAHTDQIHTVGNGNFE